MEAIGPDSAFSGGGPPTLDTASAAEVLFLENLPLIEGLIRFTARRYRWKSSLPWRGSS